MSRKSTKFKKCTCQYHTGNQMVSLFDFYLNITKSDGYNN